MGSAQIWMRGHLWLGLLSLPLILFHSGTHLGNGLAAWTMWTYLVVFITGIAGAVLQHVMPRFTTSHVLKETIYGNMDAIRTELLTKTDALLEPFPKMEGSGDQTQLSPAGSDTLAVATASEAGEDFGGQLRKGYDEIIRPYLAKRNPYGHMLSSVRISEEFFVDLRAGTPDSIQQVIAALEEICKEKRDFDRQSFLHWVLHVWLAVHVPLSAVLLLLGAIHGWKALHYH
jgi:hypothetical protein